MLSVVDIRTRLADHIETELSADATGAWRRSRHAPGRFPGVADTRDEAHHGFAISLPETSPVTEGRQRPTPGLYSATAVLIRWGHRLRADGASDDYDAALEAERRLVAAIETLDRDPAMHPRVIGLGRSETPDGLLFLGELRLAVLHHLPLTVT